MDAAEESSNHGRQEELEGHERGEFSRRREELVVGRLEGIRRDAQLAKEHGIPYDPRGVGSAWSHDFLNKKPWHPMNFRNRVKVYEAEQKRQEKERKEKAAREEYRLEQQYVKNLSYLTEEDRERYKQRQSVSFLYQRPPGYSNDNELEQDKQRKLPEKISEETFHKHTISNKKHVESVIKGIQAVSKQSMELKQGLGGGGGSSPPRGGISLDAENQQFVLPEIDSEEEELACRLASMSADERKTYLKGELRRKRKAAEREERRRIKEAKQILKEAGLEDLYKSMKRNQ